jgi:hypothetical protein
MSIYTKVYAFIRASIYAPFENTIPRKLPVTTRELYNKAVIAQSGNIASINLKALRCNTSVQREELASGCWS